MASPVRTNDPGYNPGRARWSTVRIETEGAVYVGRMFVPETKKRLSDVLCDDRPFISLTDVSVNFSKDVEEFVAINKSFVRTLRVLHEGVALEGTTARRGAEGYPMSMKPSR